MADYITVIKGCVEALPALLSTSVLSDVKDDLFLVSHYLFECCSLRTRVGVGLMGRKCFVSTGI